MGTFGLAKKDMSGENKKKRCKKKEGLVGRTEEEEEEEGGPKRRVEEGKAYDGHHPAKGSFLHTQLST